MSNPFDLALAHVENQPWFWSWFESPIDRITDRVKSWLMPRPRLAYE